MSLENDPDGQKEPQAELLDCDALETVAQECEQTLLLCIQTEFMKELILKYSDVSYVLMLHTKQRIMHFHSSLLW